jgi:hypothetical protein
MPAWLQPYTYLLIPFFPFLMTGDPAGLPVFSFYMPTGSLATQLHLRTVYKVAYCNRVITVTGASVSVGQNLIEENWN